MADNAVDQHAAELHRAIADALETQNLERRSSERHPYPARQMVAPCSPSSSPALRGPAEPMFQEVRCRDISCGGMAFYWPTTADFTEVVVRLSSGPSALCLKARVVQCAPAADPQDGYAISCQFVARLG